MAYFLGVDTGGTYTDAVILDEAANAVLGKAKALKARVTNYTQVAKLPKRLQRMVAQTRSMTIAMPWPTPMHMVTSARSSLAAPSRMRATSRSSSAPPPSPGTSVTARPARV